MRLTAWRVLPLMFAEAQADSLSHCCANGGFHNWGGECYPAGCGSNNGCCSGCDPAEQWVCPGSQLPTECHHGDSTCHCLSQQYKTSTGCASCPSGTVGSNDGSWHANGACMSCGTLTSCSGGKVNICNGYGCGIQCSEYPGYCVCPEGTEPSGLGCSSCGGNQWGCGDHSCTNCESCQAGYHRVGCSGCSSGHCQLHTHAPHAHTPHTHDPHSHEPHTHLPPPPTPPPSPPPPAPPPPDRKSTRLNSSHT